MDETPRAGRSRSAEELLDEIDRLRAEVEALREAPPDVRQPDDAEPEATSRRGMLRLAGVATAAAIAGGLAKASPAAAADPNDVVRDANNAVAGTTILSGSVNAELLRLTNTGASGRGLLATSAGTDIGAVRGDNSNSTGIGGVGVSGNAPGGRDFLAFGSGRIGMNSHSFTTVDNQYTTGEIHQTNGTLYAMVNTTTRRSIVGPATAGALYVINPARVYDSRLPAPAPGVLASGTNRVVSVADARDLTTGAVTTANLVPPGADGDRLQPDRHPDGEQRLPGRDLGRSGDLQRLADQLVVVGEHPGQRVGRPRRCQSPDQGVLRRRGQHPLRRRRHGLLPLTVAWPRAKGGPTTLRGRNRTRTCGLYRVEVAL